MTGEDDGPGDADGGRGVPCCVADAARRWTKVRVGGNLVAIAEFRPIMHQVQAMGPMAEDETRARLLELTRVYNYVPPAAEDAYADAMLEEFKLMYNDEEDRAHEG